MKKTDDAVVLVYTTLADSDTAAMIAVEMVNTGHAACANIIPGMVAVYRWAGKVEQAGEVVLILKTSPERLEALRAGLAERHPYDTPAILTIPTSANAAFAAWVGAETG